MAVTITNSQVTAYDDVVEVTANAATQTTDETAEVFTYTPTAAASGILIRVVTSAGVTMSVAAGDRVFSGQDYEETLAAGTFMTKLDLGKYINDNGEVEITFTPTGTLEDLVNDCALSVEVLESDIDTQ
jgi:hypothetical protein